MSLSVPKEQILSKKLVFFSLITILFSLKMNILEIPISKTGLLSFPNLKLHFVKLILIAAFHNKLDENDKGGKIILLVHIFKHLRSDMWVCTDLYVYIHNPY